MHYPQHARSARAGDRGQVARASGQAFACQPGECHGLDEIRIQAVRGGRLNRYPRQARGDARHQMRIAHAAAAGDQPRRARLLRAQRIGDGGRAQLQQGGLHVGRGFIAAQLRLHPVQVELLAAGALRRRQCEPRLIEQAREKSFVDLAARGKTAVGIEGRAGVAQAPGVEQRVGRAGVEAADLTVARQQGVVADPAEVEHGAVLVGGVQQRGMEGRHQRCALAAGGDVAAAEIGDRGDAGALGDHVAVADLQGERRRAMRAVANGLAVRTDRRDLRWRHAGPFQQRQRGVGEGPRDLHVEMAKLVQRRQRTTLAEGDEAFAQCRRPRMHVRGAQAQAVRGAGIGEFDQRGIDAVGAGAGNQA
jgi:hypothetical protein